jgi:hypothetical protein
MLRFQEVNPRRQEVKGNLTQPYKVVITSVISQPNMKGDEFIPHFYASNQIT